jgi:hypothetical protein
MSVCAACSAHIGSWGICSDVPTPWFVSLGFAAEVTLGNVSKARLNASRAFQTVVWEPSTCETAIGAATLLVIKAA